MVNKSRKKMSKYAQKLKAEPAANQVSNILTSTGYIELLLCTLNLHMYQGGFDNCI